MDQLSFDAPGRLSPPIPPESPLEALGLSVRTRNALRGVRCNTIEDVLRLDLERPIRGLGPKARRELLGKLDEAGFPHPADGQRTSELKLLERNLERMQERVNAALALVAKEIRSARERLHRLKSGTPQAS